MTTERLNELMLEKYPFIAYDADQRAEFLENYSGNLEDEDVVAWCFADYLVSQDLAEEIQL